MASKLVRAAASLCLILGVVALFIAFNGGAARIRVPFSTPAPDEDEQQAIVLTLPYPTAIGVTAVVLSIVCFVVSKQLRRDRTEEPADQ